MKRLRHQFLPKDKKYHVSMKLFKCRTDETRELLPKMFNTGYFSSAVTFLHYQVKSNHLVIIIYTLMFCITCSVPFGSFLMIFLH